MIEIYTDGSCGAGEGKGGWAFVVFKDGRYIEGNYKGYPSVTIGWLEVQAMYQALCYCRDRKLTATIYSDSQYVVSSVNEWFYKWEQNDWKRRDGKEISHKILMQAMSLVWKEVCSHVQVKWIKGHNGTFGNTMADDMAKMAKATA